MTTSRPPLGTVLVIIPTYNEIDNIDMITARLRAVFGQASTAPPGLSI